MLSSPSNSHYCIQLKIHYSVAYYSSVCVLSHTNIPFSLIHAYIFQGIFNDKIKGDSVVDITTYSWLNGPGIEFRWGRDFSCRPDRLKDPPNLNSTGSLSGGYSGRSVGLTTHILPVFGVRPQPPLCCCIGTS